MRSIKQLLKNKKREITLILVNIMVLSLFFSGYSMGKEYSHVAIETNAMVAEPILVVENGSRVEINDEKTKDYYNFKVKNHRENGEITQIDLLYYIEIVSKVEKAISFKLYKDNQEIALKNNKTANMKLEKEKWQEDDYQLEISYDKTQNNSVYDIIQDIQIKVHSEQMKI